MTDASNPPDHDREIEQTTAESVLHDLNQIKKAKAIPIERTPTAFELVTKHRCAIEILHEAGCRQADVYLYLEQKEGKLIHADDTLRKAVNKIIPNWRSKRSDTRYEDTKPRSAPFADRINKGVEEW
ncbi:MAG: hypothetical protein F9K30_21525 [Dechloromonas sp.]|jgi:hypothetical protein|nr:MAG: hypothetical protein F9K30_21525 [Dechloromonas sp.]